MTVSSISSDDFSDLYNDCLEGVCDFEIETFDVKGVFKINDSVYVQDALTDSFVVINLDCL